MGIRNMIPMGVNLRPCPFCGSPQTAMSVTELTAHESECITQAMKEYYDGLERVQSGTTEPRQ